jgi:hypothetical protein
MHATRAPLQYNVDEVEDTHGHIDFHARRGVCVFFGKRFYELNFRIQNLSFPNEVLIVSRI